MAETFPAPAETTPEEHAPAHAEHYTRFSLSQRIEHLILLLSFSTLGFTGLIQKYSDTPIGAGFIGLLGGIRSTRIIHRGAAIILIAVSIYHIVAVLYRLVVLRVAWTMLPTINDFVHLYQDVMYYLGRRVRKAYYGRYNYAEKAEYLAVVWGTVIMAITGFMMWNPISTTRFLPGEAVPAAKAAHGGEALLAVLAIILWHFYHVHIKRFNKSMFTGKLSREEMEDEHPAELAAIEARRAYQEIAPEVIARRRRVFLPIASVAVVVMVILLWRFATFEETAIATLPQGNEAPAFSPITPTPSPTPRPTPTPLPTATPLGSPNQPQGVSWTTGISDLMQGRCGACHVQAASGGLSVGTFQGVLDGGNRGPGVVPGNPDTSQVVIIQQAGGHPGQFSETELDKVIDWIADGAPENPAASSDAQGGATTWENFAGPLLTQRCGACHVQDSMGGLSLANLSSAQAGGSSGPAIVPGNASASQLVVIQQAGGHPGQLTSAELQSVMEWIDAGTP